MVLFALWARHHPGPTQATLLLMAGVRWSQSAISNRRVTAIGGDAAVVGAVC